MPAASVRRSLVAIGLVTLCTVPGSWLGTTFAQGLTGALIGTVTDEHGGALIGADVRLTSTALIGGEIRQTTREKGQFRFPVLPPGSYGLEVAYPGFMSFRADGIGIGVGATAERNVRLMLANRAESVVVERGGSRIDARDPGFSTRFGRRDLQAVPTRRASMFDFIRVAPGIAPTSPGSGTQTTVSAFGSGTNENLFLIDGTNFTCPCNGIARSEPGIDFIQEIHVQSIGASAEHGNIPGAVINVVTRQGGEQFLVDAAYYGQPSAFTSQPIRLRYGAADQISGYERARYRDFTTTAGGPVSRNRMWFFAGYQYLRDYDSQPGADPAFPRVYEQNKFAAKLTWKPAPGWQLMHSFHGEAFVSPESPTRTKPIASTQRRHASVPAFTLAHLTHVWSDRTVWDVRIGRFVHARNDDLHPGVAMTPSHFDQVTGIWSGAPSQLGSLTLIRTSAKATVNHYRPGWWGADHQWKYGVQVERGEGHGHGVIPTGVRYIDSGGQPLQSISSDPSRNGGLFVTAAAFVSDAITPGPRLTINAGLRFDHSRAISQDLHALDADGHETDDAIDGIGRLYTWNILSPRLGITFKLTADGRTMLRGSYGRFSQGVLTGEFSAFHPGVTPTITRAFDAATGDYTRLVRVVDSRINLRLDSGTRAPRTDEYSIGIDREITRGLAAAVAYVRKRGTDFIGWTDVGGVYREETQTMPDGSVVPVFVLTNTTAAQRFLLTNPDGYSTKYDGLVVALEKRHSAGWQAFGSYTYSRARGLLASSGTGAAAAQSSTVALPTVPIGRDPNELTNAYGRLPNDRPHMFRVMTTLTLPRTGVAVAANLQHYSGKPWAASTQRPLPQGNVRILIEPPGTRRLSSQTLLDLRVSRAFQLPGAQIELLLDLLNTLNDTAEEALATDSFGSATFGQPTIFMDPRRAMLAVRLQVGR
jgi:hypothetical protein